MSLIRSAGPFVCVCALVVSACGGPTAPSDIEEPPDLSAALATIVDLTNQARARAGLGSLRPNARLAAAAEIQAEQMAQFGRLDHVLPDARYPRAEDRLAAAGYSWQAWGENLAFGYQDARSVVEGWMQSPGHRANILGTAFTEIGVAAARDGAGRTYYAQVFGRPR